MTGQQETNEVVVYHNDEADVDNIAALMHLSELVKSQPHIELVIVFESRPVDFSLVTLKPDDRAHLDSLLRNNFGHIGEPLKIRLNGLLKTEDLDKGFSKEDQDLLRMAINHSKGSREDSKLHASLMARDLARCFNELPGSSRRGTKVTILVDCDEISDTSPVNLKCHAQEQLFNRTPEAIREFYGLMELPKEEDRRQETRAWYEKQIKEVDEKLRNSDISVDYLDFRLLTDKIRDAERVSFVEGASFKLLRRLVNEKDVAAKIDCVAQAGTLDLRENIFKNQFNIALDTKSADYVLQNPQLFRSFAAVPTHTSKSISFSLDRLEESGFSSLAKWILCFNHRQDPLNVAERNVTLTDQYRDVTIKLPDLAMILLRFNSVVYPREESKFMVETIEEESLLFVESDDGRGITAWLPKDGHDYGTVDLVDLLTFAHKGSFRIN
ncbi:hypothetical protein BFJ63_vAg15235 [Fusarium oxysporum f. sp. narcissi]|uniref:Uncharacterized protein n=1 Tax=Fusarium oxysporum f. sp. narcissi TaxID=451672 RepID=A0A4Q2VAL1_FUSOX|nr:hypothetical protein BFJ63_vAg15235 [Fusarium oxysporum f. sp. narcissi]